MECAILVCAYIRPISSPDAHSVSCDSSSSISRIPGLSVAGTITVKHRIVAGTGAQPVIITFAAVEHIVAALAVQIVVTVLAQ